jgi:hypothetical protein
MSFRRNQNIKFKKAATNDLITITDWLIHSPYDRAILGYDTQFLPLCNHVLNILNKDQELFDFVSMKKEDKKNLAISLVAYFEDFINEIGIWKAFIDTNKSLYSYSLPFYDLSEYDTEYLNIEDFAYLIYHFLSKSNESKLISAETKILDLAIEIYQYLEPMVETINPTSFYEKYLVVTGKEDFFVIKEKLSWFANFSYLLGTEYQIFMKQEMSALADLIKRDASYMAYADLLTYQLMDELIYKKYSSFSALNCLTWFSCFVIADDAVKQNIQNLVYRHSGAYLYAEDFDKENFRYINMETRREYLVYKESIKQAHRKMRPNTNVFDCHLVFWNGRWWQTGMATGREKENYKEPMIKTYSVPWTYSDDLLQKSKEGIAEMYKNHLDFYGSPLFLAKNIDNIVESTAALIKKTRMAKGNIKESPMETEAEKIRQKKLLTKQFGTNATGIGYFFIEGVGQVVEPHLGQIIVNMNAKTLSITDQKKLYFELIANINPHVSAYLIAHYPTKNLLYPVETSHKTPLDFLPYFWRFHFPSEFGLKIPMLTMVDDISKYIP